MTRPIDIAPEALAAILEHDGHSFVPLPPDLRLKARMQVSAAARSADSEDENSRAFRTRLERVTSIISDDTRNTLDETAIVFVDSPLPHASLTSTGDQCAIIVCSGLFDLVHFRTALSTMSSRISLAEDRIEPIGELKPGDAMMLAGQVALFDAYANVRAPLSVADVLSQDDARNLELGVTTSLVMLVLHELGHQALGHAEPTQVAHEIDVMSVPCEAQKTSRAQLEFDADAYAVLAISPVWRPQMLASVISLMDIFQFLETFGVRPSSEYPPAGDRLCEMTDLMNLSEDDGQFAKSWLYDYERRKITVGGTNASPEAVAKHFDRTMDVSTAYKVMRHLRAEYARLGL